MIFLLLIILLIPETKYLMRSIFGEEGFTLAHRVSGPSWWGQHGGHRSMKLHAHVAADLVAERDECCLAGVLLSHLI